MDPLLEALLRASATDRDSYRPLFFRLHDPNDRAALEVLLKREPRIQVFDELDSQLGELVRTLEPSVVFSKPAREAAAHAHLKGVPAGEYGVWVYYPWSFRLVHLLDEAEFALVRTDRNRNKITDTEQAQLATKRIGVIGLSVGQSICLTLALERSFGELRIADFDTLDLSNLNRIRSGTQSLGHLKTVNVAREIAELD
ncbi:MAG TPA: ThiF family adenylyltransferase, partial [Flavobacteriales bacterium]|nr:ThiF family adenylyltransferase [Flavobacteriales bacterium]